MDVALKEEHHQSERSKSLRRASGGSIGKKGARGVPFAESILRGLAKESSNTSTFVTLRPSSAVKSYMEEVVISASDITNSTEQRSPHQQHHKKGSASCTDSTVASSQDFEEVDEEISWSSFVSGESSANNGSKKKAPLPGELLLNFPAKKRPPSRRKLQSETPEKAQEEEDEEEVSSMTTPIGANVPFSKAGDRPIGAHARRRRNSADCVNPPPPLPPMHHSHSIQGFGNRHPQQTIRIELDGLPPALLNPSRSPSHHHRQHEHHDDRGRERPGHSDDIFRMFQWSSSQNVLHHANSDDEGDYSSGGSSANLSTTCVKPPKPITAELPSSALNNICDSDSVSTVRVSNTRFRRSLSSSSLHSRAGHNTTTTNSFRNSHDTVTTTPSETSSQQRAYCRDAAAKDRAVQLSSFDPVSGELDVHALQFAPSNSATMHALSGDTTGEKQHRWGAARGTTILRRFAPNRNSSRSFNKAASSTSLDSASSTNLTNADASLSNNINTNNATSAALQNDLAAPNFFKDYQAAYSRAIGTSSSNLSTGGDVTDSSSSNNRGSSDSSSNDGPRRILIRHSSSNTNNIDSTQHHHQQQQQTTRRHRSSLTTSSSHSSLHLYHQHHRRRSSLDNKLQKTPSVKLHKGHDLRSALRKTGRSSTSSLNINQEDDIANSHVNDDTIQNSPSSNNYNHGGKSSNRRRSFGAAGA